MNIHDKFKPPEFKVLPIQINIGQILKCICSILFQFPDTTVSGFVKSLQPGLSRMYSGRPTL